MDTGEKKAVLVVIGIVAICITILTTLLFIALWQYRVIVGISVLIMLLLGAFSGCVVAVRGTTPSHPSILKQEGGHPYEQIPPYW